MAGKFKMPSIQDIEKVNEEHGGAKGKFRVGAGLLNDASKDCVMMDISNIPREKIIKNTRNPYSIERIKELAESIKRIGLLQPLHVDDPDPETGTYKLLGGERRLTAIDLLIEDESVTEWTKDTLIPCVVRGKDAVKLDLSDENKERYAIITTNKEQRIYTDADRYMEIQEWKKIIQELREKGIDAIPGMEEETINIKGEKTRDILSKTTGMSRGTVNKFEKVTNKGSDALKDALLDGKISVSVAEKATELNEEEQKKLVKKAEKLEQEGKKLQVSDVTVQSTQKVNLSESEWTKDTEDIVAMLQQNDVKLDEQALKKYHFYIKQIKKIVGGRL